MVSEGCEMEWSKCHWGGGDASHPKLSSSNVRQLVLCDV